MFKHRDTDELNNRINYFDGAIYDFIGLVNASSLDGEVWAGMNEAGLCIMNTASYNLREDTLACQMDREGEMMYHVLSNCASLQDFECWLSKYPKPWGVEANFGLIDAMGGAAYYEINNYNWIKYDVNKEVKGYRVVTNFSFAGRYEDYEGWERYITATAIMEGAFNTNHQMSATEALNLFSRQYRHELLDIDFDSVNALIENGFVMDGTGRPGFTGCVAIEGDRISDVFPGLPPPSAEQSFDNVVNAAGLAVSPARAVLTIRIPIKPRERRIFPCIPRKRKPSASPSWPSTPCRAD